MQAPSNRRKKLLVYPEFQKKYLLHTAVISSGVILILYGLLKYNLNGVIQTALNKGLNPSHLIFQYLNDQKQSLDIFFGFGALLSTLFILAYNTYLSNKVAGPIHRITRHLREIQEGKHPKPLRLREKDFFRELSEEINRTIEKSKP